MRRRNSAIIIELVANIIVAVVEAITRHIKYKSETGRKRKQRYPERIDIEYEDSVPDVDADEADKTDIIENTEKKPKQPVSAGILRTVVYIFTFIAVAITLFMIFTNRVTPSEIGLTIGFIAFLVIVFVVISFIVLSLIGILYKITGDKHYARFAEARDKNVFTYFLDRGVFLRDKHFWILILAVSFCLLIFGENPSIETNLSNILIFMILVSIILIPVYLIRSTRLNLLCADAAVAAPEEPNGAVSMNATMDKMRRMCGNLEDEELVRNVQEIIKYTKSIEEALLKYPDAKKGKLVLEYNAELLKFLNTYNEAEDLRLSNKASLDMMENTRAYAKDLVVMLRDILERLYESNAETIDVNIEVMRKDMRMRGYVKDGE